MSHLPRRPSEPLLSAWESALNSLAPVSFYFFLLFPLSKQSSSSLIALSPSPSTYELKSQFKKDGKKGKTFGIAREAFAKVYLKSAPNLGKSPGPGAYNIAPIIGKNGSKYTMRLRTALLNDNVTAKIVPGPGQYMVPPAITPNGRYMYAKYRSSAVTLFSPPTSTRFKENSAFFGGFQESSKLNRATVARTWELWDSTCLVSNWHVFCLTIPLIWKCSVLSSPAWRYYQAH